MKQMFRHVLSMLIAVMISLVFCTCCLSTASAADEKGRQLSITWMSPEGYSTQVALRTAGLTMCLVRMGGTDRWIPTSELSWETNTTYEERVAYINAPSTGRVTMRKTEKPKSLILQKIPTGRIALVFDKGDQYSGVYCDGMGGYVITSTLVFAGNRTHHGMATVSYEGSTTRTTRLRRR